MLSSVAIVWVYRLAIALSPVVTRICATQGCDANQWANALARWDAVLNDITADPAEISAGMSLDLGAPEGGTAVVTDYTGTFELRKLQWRLSRAPAGRTEDVDVMTFHFLKTSAGAPAAWNDATDLAAVETAFNTLTTTLKPFWLPTTHSDQYRWYADGPAFYALNGDGTNYVPIGDNPALRITEVDVAGTSATTAALPPQVAFSMTEITSQRKHWGRFYFVAQDSVSLDATGLMKASTLGNILTAWVTAYNACRSASVTPVVWSIQKPVRPKRPAGTLPAWPAHAFEVTALQADDIMDVVRSRRYRSSVTKTRTALT